MYKKIILPYVYDEFLGKGDEVDTEYLGLGLVLDKADLKVNKAFKSSQGEQKVSAIIIQPEGTGDLSIVSVYTLSQFRRKGYASMLLDKAISVARRMFIWDEYDDDKEVIVLKTLYRLPDNIRPIYEEFLMKNHFTDFIQIESAKESQIDDGFFIDVWSASCEIAFFKNVEDAVNA